MVAKAAVKIRVPIRDEEVIIPCHRHVDAYEILNALHYRDGKEYYALAEGFLDENDNFMTRAEAWQEARRCHQFTDTYIEEHIDEDKPVQILYSEDLW